jgi:parallel beta helix pectate lyase-like protein
MAAHYLLPTQCRVGRARVHRVVLLLLLVSLSYCVTATSAARRPSRHVCSRTLTSGSIERFVNGLSAGKTGCLKGAFEQDVDIRRRGVTLRSAPGARAYVCGNITVEDSADDFTLRGLKIDGSCTGLNTIYLRGDRTRLLYNDITNRHKGQSCILVGQSPSGWEAESVIISRNRIHDCGSDATRDQGIYLLKTTGSRIEDNVIYDVSAFALQFWGDVRNSTFAHNVTDGGPASARGGLVVGGDSDPLPSGNLVENNIISYTASAAVEGWGGDRNLVRDNCFSQNRGGQFSGSGFSQVNNRVVRASPFVNRNAHDYRLRRGSRCAGKGPRH